MPSAQHSTDYAIRGGHSEARPRITGPLEYSGSLDAFEHSDSTPVIGREYHNLHVKDLLEHADADRLIRDLAITGVYLLP